MLCWLWVLDARGGQGAAGGDVAAAGLWGR